MFRFAIYTAAGGFLAACTMVSAPSTARADDAYDVQSNTRNVTWNRYGRWRNRSYRPYYQNNYRYGSPYGRSYNYRPNYGYRNYGYRNYGYRDYGYGNRYRNYGYRRGGSVNLGGLRFYWR